LTGPIERLSYLLKDKGKERETMKIEERIKEQTMIDIFVRSEMRKFFR